MDRMTTTDVRHHRTKRTIRGDAQMPNKRPDPTELIDGLNQDLAYEYSSVIQYRTYASMVRGPHRLTLKPMFESEIPDELRHAARLAEPSAHTPPGRPRAPRQRPEPPDGRAGDGARAAGAEGRGRGGARGGRPREPDAAAGAKASKRGRGTRPYTTLPMIACTPW